MQTLCRKEKHNPAEPGILVFIVFFLKRRFVLFPSRVAKRSHLPRVILCGTSIFNAFLRGEPSHVTVSPPEAVVVLEEASTACQRCLDYLESKLSPTTREQGAGVASGGALTYTLPFHARFGFSGAPTLPFPFHASFGGFVFHCFCSPAWDF